MRISSQNSQFAFNFPQDFVETYLEEQFNKLLQKNFIPYDNAVDYINSAIKEIVMVGVRYETKKQVIQKGKEINWKDSKSVFDTFTNEVDITFRSVDSYLNYFFILQILNNFYLDNKTRQVDYLSISMLDKDGTLIYNIYFNEVIFLSISEARLGYQHYDISEKTFTVTFLYNFIDIRWELDDDDKRTSTSIFDVPINFKPGKLDKF